MSLYELEIGWAETTDERRYVHWELLVCDEVLGVFRTARDDALAVLFTGDRDRFYEWTHTLAPEAVA
jgi:hypothetical protein